MNESSFYASGKLMLFGEYLVLRGSKCLAVPLSAGQSLTISPSPGSAVLWECFEGDHKWLEIVFSDTLEIIRTSDKQKALIVQELLKLILKDQPYLKVGGSNFRFDINFHRKYGFGTSATFISLLSQWSGVDPYILLENSFGGSGFDVATATAATPVIYKMHQHKVTPVRIPETIQSQLLFIYSGKKQHSAREVLSFEKLHTSALQVSRMDTIIDSVVACEDVETMESLIEESEMLLSGILKAVPVKNRYFDDYPFAIKSLGAWGGDFIMATFRDEDEARQYFSTKGCKPVFNYKQLIKS